MRFPPLSWLHHFDLTPTRRPCRSLLLLLAQRIVLHLLGHRARNRSHRVHPFGSALGRR